MSRPPINTEPNVEPRVAGARVASRWTHPLVLQWLIVVGAVAFAALVSWWHGALALVFDSDPSGISMAIAAVFVIASVHAGARVLALSAEHQRVDALARAVQTARASARVPALHVAADGTLVVDGNQWDEGLFTQHLTLLVRLPPQQQGLHGALADALERRIMGAHQVGWLVADLMVKLGLLGTVIGFIAMLGALTTMGSFDVAAVQGLLLDMSTGMRIALFTTLSGLSAGVLLGIQYHVVERGAEQLLAHVSELSAEITVLRGAHP